MKLLLRPWTIRVALLRCCVCHQQQLTSVANSLRSRKSKSSRKCSTPLKYSLAVSFLSASPISGEPKAILISTHLNPQLDREGELFRTQLVGSEPRTQKGLAQKHDELFSKLLACTLYIPVATDFWGSPSKLLNHWSSKMTGETQRPIHLILCIKCKKETTFCRDWWLANLTVQRAHPCHPFYLRPILDNP